MPDVAAARARRPLAAGPVFGVCMVVTAMLLAAWLTLTGLGNHLFWDDEANTGLYAQNLLKVGRLTSWDGTNLVGYAFGGSLGEDLGRELRVPPLPAYLAALGIFLFRDPTIGGRMPSVLTRTSCVLRPTVSAPACWATRSPTLGPPIDS